MYQTLDLWRRTPLLMMLTFVMTNIIFFACENQVDHLPLVF